MFHKINRLDNIERPVNTMIKKTCLLITLTLLICCALCGCGSVRSAKSLIRQAKLEHGKCELISQSETKDRTEVVLRDSLQGFEYKVYSYMSDINIDGSSFGSLPSSGDTFGNALIEYVSVESSDRVEAICKKYGITMSDIEKKTLSDIEISPETPESDGIRAIEEIAAVIQEYNLDNRLDGHVINLSHDSEWLHEYYEQLQEGHGSNDIYSDPEYSYSLSSAGGSEASHIGSVKLPDTKFRDREKENEDYYLEMAQMKNTKAVFVRSEKKTFADTGISLDRVVYTYYQYYPEKMTDPVTFYYFSAEGKEFYICNFLDADLRTTTWYSNYDEIFQK